MNELVVLVVEDEPEVRDAIVRDLRSFLDTIRIDAADDVDDALDAINDVAADGDHLGLILADHRLPGRSGVDLLVSLHRQEVHRMIRKVLISGQAEQQDTIRAINDAGLNHYIAKPWELAELRAVVTDQLTDFVIESGLGPLPFVHELDGPRLVEAFSRAGRPE